VPIPSEKGLKPGSHTAQFIVIRCIASLDWKRSQSPCLYEVKGRERELMMTVAKKFFAPKIIPMLADNIFRL
jgi:hypothetical protein